MKSKLTSNKSKAPLAIDSEGKEIDPDSLSGNVSGGAPARGRIPRQPDTQRGRIVITDSEQARSFYPARRLRNRALNTTEILDSADSKLNIK